MCASFLSHDNHTLDAKQLDLKQAHMNRWPHPKLDSTLCQYTAGLTFINNVLRKLYLPCIHHSCTVLDCPQVYNSLLRQSPDCWIRIDSTLL